MRPPVPSAVPFGRNRWIRWLPAGLPVWISVLLLLTAAEGKAQQGPPLFEAFFVQGLMALEQGRNPDAAKLLEEALRYSPDRQDARKFLMIAAFRAEDYSKAIEEAERFLQTETDPEVSLLLARSYQATGEPEKAREIYATIAELEDEEYGPLAEEAITALEAEEEEEPTGLFARPPRLSGFVIAGFEYDSNIASSVEEGAQEPSEVGDGRFVSTVQLDYNGSLGSRYFAGVGFLGFGNFHFDDGRDFDFQLLEGRARTGLVGGSWRLQIEYQHDRVFFDYDEDLVSNRAEARFINIFSQVFVSSLIAAVSWDDFPNNPDQDAIKYDLRSRNRFYIPYLKEGAYVEGNYRFVFNNTQHRSVFQYYSNEVGVGFFHPLPVFSTYVDVDGSFEIRPYAEPDPNDRTDLNWEWSVTLGKEIIEDFSLELTFRRLITNSSLNDFDKTENIVGAYTILTF